jgi:hypothetical protein
MTSANQPSIGPSPKRLAQIAGVLYLIVGIFSAFAFGYVLPKIYAAGDATTTAANVLANSSLVRLGVVADLVQATVLVFVAMTLYLLLRHVSKNAARAMVILAVVAATIMCLNLVFEFGALLVATTPSYALALGAAGSNALVMLLLDLHHYGFVIAQIFFGLWLVPMGYLAFKSGMFSRALSVLLVVTGLTYLVDLLLTLLAPDLGKQIHGFLAIAPIIAEPWMVGYLLWIGLRSTRPADRRSAAGLASVAV